MCGSIVEIIVVFFDVFAVVALFSRQTKEALFEDGVPAIPQCQGETNLLVAVADSCQPVFSPAIHLGASLIMRQVVPGSAIGTVVFAHSSPRPLTQIRPPPLPINSTLLRLLKPLVFRCHNYSSFFS